MKYFIPRLFSLTALLLPAAIPAFSQGQPYSLNKIIAKIDNYYVLKSDLEQAKQSYVQQNQTPPADCQLLESLVVQKMLLAKAEIDSVTVEDKMVENQMDSRMSYMIQQFGSEKNLVEAYGKSIESLKSELRQEVKEQMLGQRMQTKITDDVKVSPSEVRKFFNSIPKDSLPYIPAEAEIAHIVRFAKVTREQKDELRKRLLALKERVQKGEDFAKLAGEFSEDVGSAQKGGDLGFAKRGMMVPEFEGAALKLKPGEMSDIVESDFGLHLIQLIETRGAEYHARHILLRPDYNRLDVTDPTRFLDSIRTLILTDTLKFERAAKDFSEDKGTADAGGILRDPQTNSSLMALDGTMDYSLFMTLDTMKVGAVSPPLPYRTEDGKSAVRILYYKRKVNPHTANLKDDYEKIGNIVMANKKNKAIDGWFKKAVGDVYIKVDPEYESCRIIGTQKTEGP
ncbi:peptidylprolyl isomerase [Larkinella soli]|uniref:peptidylprolyl isomerase n=1 Tax=Larkinella soli TaxID=1770527 RepID=UPI000FFCAFDF|nr:peptidylprolyl isomerase [Larkinella soli]